MRNRFRTINIVINSLGLLLIILGGLLLIPLIFAFLYGEISDSTTTLFAFLAPSLLSFLLGLLFFMVFKRDKPDARQAILICCLGWLSYSAISALPFVIGLGVDYLDGFFEAMSGFTTTGITMLYRLDDMPRSIIFFRAQIQWIGGLGILALFLVLFYSKGSAYQLFHAESHKADADMPVPGLADTLKIFWIIYTGFTLFIIICLSFSGMTVFDSICHSFTALATGGFSPHDASIEYYRLTGHPNYILIEYILILGMVLGGMNFLIHYRVLKGDIKALFSTSEMRYWWGFIGLFVLIIMAERYISINGFSLTFPKTGFWVELEKNIRNVLFQTVSIFTTTGFATNDIGGSFFGSVARQLFLVMMVIGGCVGSTSGGVKVYRVAILIRLVKWEVFRLRVPQRSVTPLLIDGKPIHRDEVYRVCGIFAAWIGLLIIGGCITAFFSNLNVVQSFSGMCSALGNIGPCYISGYDLRQLNPIIKVVYIFGMLAGRLEILPILLLFRPKAWI
jgi:trk system potassium uptake protein TrkH